MQRKINVDFFLQLRLNPNYMRGKYDLHLIFYTLYKKNSSARNKTLWIAHESYCIEGVSSYLGGKNG